MGCGIQALPMKLIRRRLGGLDILEKPGDPQRGTIVLLHGFGADANDLAPLCNTYEGPTWIFPQGPLEIPFSPDDHGRAWFPVNIALLTRAVQERRWDEIFKAFPPQLNEARDCVDALLDALNIPRSQIVLGGFSQGAVLAVETALHSPLRCGGLVIFSGTLINEINWRQLAPLHRETPFFQSHGTHDPLLPLPNAQALSLLLQEGGLKGELYTFKGGHDIPSIILKQLSSFLHNLI